MLWRNRQLLSPICSSTYSLFTYILASRFRSTADQKMHDYLDRIRSDINSMWNDSLSDFGTTKWYNNLELHFTSLLTSTKTSWSCLLLSQLNFVHTRGNPVDKDRFGSWNIGLLEAPDSGVRSKEFYWILSPSKLQSLYVKSCIACYFIALCPLPLIHTISEMFTIN
jgi:hypothetical protein